MVEMRNITGGAMKFGKHPCLCYGLGLGEMQRGPDLGFPTNDKFSEILLNLVSTC